MNCGYVCPVPMRDIPQLPVEPRPNILLLLYTHECAYNHHLLAWETGGVLTESNLERPFFFFLLRKKEEDKQKKITKTDIRVCCFFFKAGFLNFYYYYFFFFKSNYLSANLSAPFCIKMLIFSAETDRKTDRQMLSKYIRIYIHGTHMFIRDMSSYRSHLRL